MTFHTISGDQRRPWARVAATFLLTLAVAVMAAACSDGADGSDDAAATAATAGGASATSSTDQPLAQRWGAQAIAESVQDSPVQPVIVNSNIGLGPTR